MALWRLEIVTHSLTPDTAFSQNTGQSEERNACTHVNCSFLLTMPSHLISLWQEDAFNANNPLYNTRVDSKTREQSTSHFSKACFQSSETNMQPGNCDYLAVRIEWMSSINHHPDSQAHGLEALPRGSRKRLHLDRPLHYVLEQSVGRTQ